MTCRPVRLDNGAAAIVCGPGPRATRCAHCDRAAAYLCDYVLTTGHTCDGRMCRDHATEDGPDRHYCPLHCAAPAAEPVKRCGICGTPDGAEHDLHKHGLFERLRAAPGIIEPLSPLAADLAIAHGRTPKTAPRRERT